MFSSSTAALTLLLGASFCFTGTDAHGMLTSPRSRNKHALDTGVSGIYAYEASALNNNNVDGTFSNTVCGRVQGAGRNFDQYNSGSQATYSSGQEITVQATITVFHYGHFEFALCPANDVTRACFARSSNKLRVIRDNYDGAPVDPNYPNRAMLKPRAHIATTYYSYQVKLPSNLASGSYVLRWQYVTGNSCVAPGYKSYPFPSSWGPMYTNNLDTCGNYDLNAPSGMPEVFVNCAEVTIGGSSPSPPSPTPPSSGTCGGGSRGNGICADNKCCSPYGWCDCTSAHCVNGQTCGGPSPPAPSPTPPAPTPAGSCGGGSRGNGICADKTCCSPYGWCGCTSAHCTNGQTCGGPVAGTCGGGSRGNGICADGNCCSPYGWCGCTSAHCTNGQTCK